MPRLRLRPIMPPAGGPMPAPAPVAGSSIWSRRRGGLPAAAARRAIRLAPALFALAVAMQAPAAGTAAAADGPAARPEPRQPAVDNLEALRQRLAEKLGARPVGAEGAGSGGALRLANRADASGAEIAPAPGGRSAAPRKPSAAVLAVLDTQRGAASAPPPAPTGPWSYSGETGPAAWGGLKPEFAVCAKGQRQSPIDIRGGIAVDLEPVQFDYRASGFSVLSNGYTVQVGMAPGNHIQVGGRRYELVQFHFHRPSETRIDGRQFDMDVHLLHKDPEGRLAVVAVPLERGAPQPVVQTVWNHLPLEKGEDQLAAGAVIDLNHLLPPDRGYYTYMGSLTEPPCSEGVLWLVMRQPVTLSTPQLEIFARLYPMNARPVQSAAGRLIKQSQ